MANRLVQTHVYQHNIGKRRDKAIDLVTRCDTVDSYICLIQEPYAPHGQVKFFNSFSNIYDRNCGKDRPPRALISHHPDLPIQPTQFTGRDVVCALWDIGAPNMSRLMLVSLYWDGTVPNFPRKFLACLEWCEEHDIPLHIAGDFNARSTLWYDRFDTGRGNRVCNDVIFRYDLTLLNEDGIATFRNRRGESIIDLTITSGECGEYMSMWGVTQRGENDHALIECRYMSKAPAPKFRRSEKNVDWDAFRKSLCQKLRNLHIPDTMDRNDLDDYTEAWNDSVRSSINEFTTSILVKPRPPIVKLWYTEDLRKEKTEVYRLGRVAIRTKRAEDWDIFHEAQRTYSRNLRKAARECYRKFATDIPTLNDMAKFCQMVRRQPRHDIGVMRKDDGNFTSTTEESLDIVMDNAFPDSEEVPNYHRRRVRLENETLGQFTVPPIDFINVDTIRDSFSGFKNSKSAGPDQFKPRLLKNLPDLALEKLAQLFRASYHAGYVPQEWLLSKVVFISKPGKTDYCTPSSFRPICLTSFVFKCMERVVYKNLLQTSLKETPLNVRQHGFRHGMSTDTALSMMVGRIEKALNRKKISVGIFLDIKGAFDNVNIAFTQNALLERGFDPKMVAWYSHYLGNRIATVTIRGITIRRLLRRGVPQGGILSPLAWNCNIDRLLDLFNMFDIFPDGDVVPRDRRYVPPLPSDADIAYNRGTNGRPRRRRIQPDAPLLQDEGGDDDDSDPDDPVPQLDGQVDLSEEELDQDELPDLLEGDPNDHTIDDINDSDFNPFAVDVNHDSSDTSDELPDLPPVVHQPPQVLCIPNGNAIDVCVRDDQGRMTVNDEVIPNDVLVPAFADDVSALASSDRVEDAVRSVQWALDRISHWVHEAGLALSPAKSVAVLFHRRGFKVHDPPKLVLNGVQLEWQSEARYLGVYLDTHLNFRSHMKRKINNAKWQIMKLNESIGKLWGPNPYLTRWAYLCVIRPAITFGHFIWAWKCNTKGLKLKFQRVQAQALRLCGHFRHGTPKVGMEMVLNVPPLDLFLQFEMGRSYFRLRDHLKSHRWYTQGEEAGHVQACENAFLEADLDNTVPDFCEELNINKSYTVKMNSFDSGKVQCEPDRQLFYTDGSKLRDGSAGYGVYVPLPRNGEIPAFNFELKQHLGNRPTVYQAEALAITRACRVATLMLSKGYLVNGKITIYTDSQSVLRALNSRWIRSQTILDCSRALSDLGQWNSVHLRWVKGHSGVRGNEEADRLAREAAETPGPLPGKPIPSSPSYYRQAFKTFLYDKWKRRWQSNIPDPFQPRDKLTPQFARQTKIWFPEPSFRKTRQLLALSRSDFSDAMRWITGHAFLRLQNHRVDEVAHPDTECRHCKESPERADHVLLRCKSLLWTRMWSFHTWSLDVSDHNWEVSNLVRFINTPVVKGLELPLAGENDILEDTWSSSDDEEEDDDQPLPHHAPLNPGAHAISDSD